MAIIIEITSKPEVIEIETAVSKMRLTPHVQGFVTSQAGHVRIQPHEKPGRFLPVFNVTAAGVAAA